MPPLLLVYDWSHTQETMRPLLLVYDRSYTHKSGNLLSIMVIYHFLWSFKFLRICCGHLKYIMVNYFSWENIFFSFCGHFLDFMVMNCFFVLENSMWPYIFINDHYEKICLFIKFYVTIFFHKWPLWNNLFISKILCDHLFL